MTTASGGHVAALHHVILRIAGWASDETIHTLRDWLAQNRTVDVARAALFTTFSNRIPVTREDATTLADAAEEADVHDLLDLVPSPAFPYHIMSPMHPARHVHSGAGPHCLDLTGQPEEHDEIDRTAVEAASDVAGFRGLWRAWRSPAFATPWPPPRRVYLLQVAGEDQSRLPAYAAELQTALERAGETHPQVEVFTDPESLPPYQRVALGWAALLATADPTPPIRIAGVFDAVDDTGGPGFSATHPTLDDGERDKVLGYLDAGTLILPTTAMMGDVLDDARRPAVPMGFRSDGHWVWSDATAYFLRRYRIAPDPELLDHVRDRGHEAAPLGAVGMHRATAALEAEGSDGDA
ncbi:MAG: hypothetical protein ACRDT4_06130 [Micromonosporaceae bacterium]